jgi:hypothetical protein
VNRRRHPQQRAIEEAGRPEELFEALAAVATTTEQRLMVAALLDAMVQLRQHGSPGAREAQAWIGAADPDDDVAYSFANICRVLGVDAVATANALLKVRNS